MQAAPAFQIYLNVRGCRIGDGEYLDFQAAVKFMELHEIEPDTQAEIFAMIAAVEADWRQRRADVREIERQRREAGKGRK